MVKRKRQIDVVFEPVMASRAMKVTDRVLRAVAGEEAARAVPLVSGVVVTAKIDQRLVALPEGASYLGFLFAEGPHDRAVHHALRAAHACLTFQIDPVIDVRAARP